MYANLINHILKEGFPTPIKALSFHPGQIISGKVIKLFPDNIATLQAGTQKIVAQLEAPLEAGKAYWFQVLPGEGKPRLRVLVNAADPRQNDIPLTALLKQLSLPLTEENQAFIHFLLKEQLPVNKEIFQLAGEFQKCSTVTSSVAEAINLLLQKGIPLTKSSFQAILSALNNETFTQLLENLSSLLKQQALQEDGKKLLGFLQNMYRRGSDRSDILSGQMNNGNATGPFVLNIGQNLSDGSMIVRNVKGIIQHTGLTYEQDFVQFLKHPHVEQEMNREAFKPLLLDFLKEEPTGAVKEAAEKVLNKITGIQLLGQDSGPIQQIALQLPIMLGQKAVDLIMQWSGKKQENGQIDPAYCRVLFYIELEHLQETIVDMQVQNRVIRLRVINEHEELKDLAVPFIEGLKENLQTMNFTLSAIQFTRPKEDVSKHGEKQYGAAIFDTSCYSGVDIKI
nr:hypothetical protein [uncultured Bacillus sp.]